MRTYLLSILFLFIILISSFIQAAIVEEGFYINDPEKKYLNFFYKHKSLTIDLVSSSGYELYGPKGLGNWIDGLGIIYSDLNSKYEIQAHLLDEYDTPEEVSKKLKNLVDSYPSILHLFSIGTSVEGRKLWVMKISDNPRIDEVEPEVKYIANMHGNEIVGRELMVKLIEELAIKYNNDLEITSLIDNSEIFIMPSMNPDGASKMRRGNANWIDLNRDFPDFTGDDNQNVPEGRAPETKAVMIFQRQRHFALSSNFHGGAVVVNYPWDTTDASPPLEDLIINISLDYASTVPGMYDSSYFPKGITNGYDWYEVNGGMQDWSYYWHDDLQLTIELSEIKWPPYSTIEKFYNDNRDSLIRFIKRAHQGAGLKFKTLSDGELSLFKIIKGDRKLIGNYHFNHGEFFKVLNEGFYQFVIKGPDESYQQINVKVEKDRIYPNGNYKYIP